MMSRHNKRAAWFGPCRNPWHQDTNAPHGTYRIHVGRYTMEGYRCRTCRFETATIGWYIPTPKPCLECGNTFDGMPDYPEEACDDCFDKHLAQWVQEQLATK